VHKTGGDMLREPLPANAARRLLLAVAALVVLASPLILPAFARGPLRIGDTPPRVSVADLGGHPIRIPDDLRGKVAILHFWVGGCSSCREEMPAMESLFARYRKRGVVILAVNVGQRKEKVRAFAEGLKVTYPISTFAVGKNV